MKRQLRLPLIVILLIGCMIFTACGGSSTSSAAPAARPSSYAAAQNQEMAYDAETAAVADDASVGLNGSGAPAEVAVDTNRKIIRNAWLTLETKEFDQALDSLNTLIEEHGGYVQNQNVSGRSIYRTDGYYSRSASVVARVPADRLDAVINAAEGICNVLSREVSSDDITDSYFDSEARLRSLTMQEERLLDILSKADKLEDILVLEQALTEVRYQIEALTTSLRRMDQQVSYSTLQFELSEVVDYREPVSQPKSLGERLAASWNRSINRVGVIAESLLILAIETLPSLLIFVGIPLVVLLLLFRVIRKPRGNRTPSTPSSSPTPPSSHSSPPASTRYAPPASKKQDPPTAPPASIETKEQENKEDS